jgi:drug/metabolite transporter (DMT)-like permease
MSLAVLLGLASGLCWGTADFFGGLQARRWPALIVALWGQLGGGTSLLVALALRGDPPAPEGFLWGMGAGIFGGVGLVLFYRGLADGLMSIVAPVSACGAVVPVIVAITTGEIPSAVTAAGLVAAVAGIVLVSLSTGRAPHPSGRPLAVLGLALGAALGFGMFFVFLNQGADRAGDSVLWVVLGAKVASLVLLAAIVALSRPRPAWPGRRILPLALVGVADTTANVLFAVASTQGNLGVVAVLGSLYPVATLILARLLLAERLAGVQATGVGLALAGVVFMSAG